ncbi:hypothetical protein TESG_07351 [Trichophyton tonsurans CBS 112818]|uniref:Uncharacterized protein n=2 Tax=Trichophyton TaxID=5550 RepID=F2PTT0_TRIEC|nr:hypothetical protein TESG_07351 [Trichophyton tonsurans CBS 112818]EGE05298.1 hypothetical protein TEQG_04453 [Trichophyton equinum CBS 127.97]
MKKPVNSRLDDEPARSASQPASQSKETKMVGSQASSPHDFEQAGDAQGWCHIGLPGDGDTGASAWKNKASRCDEKPPASQQSRAGLEARPDLSTSGGRAAVSVRRRLCHSYSAPSTTTK